MYNLSVFTIHFQDKPETLSETKDSDGKESVEKAKDERKCYQNTRNQKTRMMQPALLNHSFVCLFKQVTRFGVFFPSIVLLHSCSLKTTVTMYSNSNGKSVTASEFLLEDFLSILALFLEPLDSNWPECVVSLAFSALDLWILSISTQLFLNTLHYTSLSYTCRGTCAC